MEFIEKIVEVRHLSVIEYIFDSDRRLLHSNL